MLSQIKPQAPVLRLPGPPYSRTADGLSLRSLPSVPMGSPIRYRRTYPRQVSEPSPRHRPEELGCGSSIAGSPSVITVPEAVDLATYAARHRLSS